MIRIDNKMGVDLLNSIKQIYDSLIDKKSKKLFIYRLMFGITGEYKYLYDFLTENFKYNNQEIIEYKIKSQYKDRKLIIYGASNSAKWRLKLLNGLGLDICSCFCDKDIDKQKNGFLGKKVISIENLEKNYHNEIISIESQNYYNEIYDDLIIIGIPKENILSHPNCGNIYFDLEYFEFGEEEFFVDCGPFNGNDELRFKNTCNGKYKKIIAFEPDKENFIKCKEFYKQNNIENIKIVNKGVWYKEDTIFIKNDLEQCSYITEDKSVDTVKIDVISIDKYLENEKVTFIKMDIEGAEKKALEGAKNIIKTNKPKLAISVYHKPEDILDIPIYIKKLVPEYKLAIRHYTDFECDTVVFAWI